MDAKRLCTLAILLVQGCATIQLPPIQRGETISILARGSEPARVEFYNNAMGQGAATGSKAGFFLGALLGLTCGPWVLFCVPAAGAAFSGFGALGGTAVGATQGPDSDSREVLMAKIRAGASDDPDRDLVAAVKDMARGHWGLADLAGSTTVLAHVDEYALHARRGDRIAFHMKASVVVRRAGSPQTPEAKVFEYSGPESDTRAWLEDPALSREAFAQALRHLAREVVLELSR